MNTEAERSEIVQMLVQEGLTEVTTSSLSEQVAYLLADRAALMERTQAQEDAGSKTLNVKCTQKQITDENKEKVRCFVVVLSFWLKSNKVLVFWH